MYLLKSAYTHTYIYIYVYKRVGPGANVFDFWLYACLCIYCHLCHICKLHAYFELLQLLLCHARSIDNTFSSHTADCSLAHNYIHTSMQYTLYSYFVPQSGAVAFATQRCCVAAAVVIVAVVIRVASIVCHFAGALC